MSQSSLIIAPSLYAANSSFLGEEIKSVEQAGADMIHFDIMDGHFTPHFTFGAKLISDLRTVTELPFDVHLMISDPDKHLATFASAGAYCITIHYESTHDTLGSLLRIRELGKKAGISILPSTPVELIREILPYVDLVLVLLTTPGYNSESMLSNTLHKIEQLVEIRDSDGLEFVIEADGGITTQTIKQVCDAGAEVVVVGSALFGAVDRGGTMQGFRALVESQVSIE